MISDLILIAKKFRVPSAYGRSDGVRDFFAQYPDGVYIATDAGAPAGWEGYAVWFGGAGERYAERFMELIRDGYIVERFLRARVGGLLVFTFRCRLKMRRFGTLGNPYGGASPLDKWWGLKLTMPDGGTVILRKNGNPTAVNLEVSVDAVHWSAWTLSGTDYTYALSAGQTLCIRNTSETATGFSTNANDYWNFVLDSDTYASGSLMSLICKNPVLSFVGNYALRRLFAGCNTLISPPELPATGLTSYCYYSMFYGCSALATAPSLPAQTLSVGCYYYMFGNCISLLSAPELKAQTLMQNSYLDMFYGCSSLNKITTSMVNISASGALTNWLYGVSPTGDFYCPASLTIPSGVSGIPNSWTRHDI